MNRTTCCVLLLGTLLPLSAAAEKAGAAGGRVSADLAKNLAPAVPAAGFAGHLDRADIAALLQARAPFSTPAHRPGVMVDELGRPRQGEGNPLARGGGFGRPAIRGLHWDDASGARGLVQDYNALGDAMKAKIFGEDLGGHLDIELDGSPHIRYKVEFD